MTPGACDETADGTHYSRRLRLHLAAALQGLPAAFALTGAKAGEHWTRARTLAGMR